MYSRAYRFLVVGNGFIPYRWVATASCRAGTPAHRNGIRAIHGLADVYHVGCVQPYFLHDGQHAIYPSIFVELLVHIAENKPALVGIHVQHNLMHAFAEALEIGGLFRIFPAECLD